ncbi:putative 3-isopropylmalate protein [Lasiosphaeria ovina]|uniref:3-isopropylmalate dehydrogenase n=1 Tax=Lasiosphaeria ovina TaxID=92902 RepID=A0AAE0NDN9_9PEZI|nr:putative 3-isopropylmalate protein [Lasiosphaeria ovina]
MSGDQPASSFGDPNAQPPTPKQTPTSTIFPSPIFETPKANQGQFDESSGWTPRFAEEYSGSFADFGPTSPYTLGIAAEIASHVNHFSPNPNLPPVDPSQRLQSSPAALDTPLSAKRARRTKATRDSHGQTATPPPSARKGERKLGFGQPDFMGTNHHGGMDGYVTTPTDVFGYPLSAPATAPAFGAQQSFWNPDAGMGAGVFRAQHASHQPPSAADWGRANQMLQHAASIPGQHGQGIEGHSLPLGSHQSQTLQASSAEQQMFAASYATQMDDPFGIGVSGGAVNPGLIFSRPPSSSMDTSSFNAVMQTQNAPAPMPSQETRVNGRGPALAKASARNELRRSASEKELDPSKQNQAPATSPVKSSGRPGLSRSFSENRGKKQTGRPILPTLAPAPRPRSQAQSQPQPQPQSQSQSQPQQPPTLSNGGTNRPIVVQSSRPNGRISPLKSNHHQRLSSLSSIPETVGPRTRTQAKFTIDSNGRARVETTIIVDDEPPLSIRKRHSAQPLSRRRQWGSSEDDDDSSTDDEPIVIPSRNTSFALPDPRKPTTVHPFHYPQRSVSDRSTTSYTTFRRASQGGGDSDGETVLNDVTPTAKPSGDAASELRKLRKSRQRQLSTSKANSFAAGGRGTGTAGFAASFAGGHNNNAPAPRGLNLSFPKCTIRPLVRPRLRPPGGRRRQKMATTHNIVVFGGDHCGPEVVAEAIKVLKSIEIHSPSAGKFNLQEHLLGGASIDVHKDALTDEALSAAKAADAILLGAIGGPEWGPSSPVRPEQGILKLRKELGTYGNLRPCSFASESLVDRSPLKAEVCRGTDFVVVRELTGGIYFGDRVEDDGSGYACDTEPYTRPEIERIARLSGFLALASNPPAKVWSLDKANVLATSRLWRKVVTEVFAKEFPQLQLGHHLIDSAAMLMIKNPRALNGVVMTSNLFGDIISDEASVIPGSIGLLPSASLGGIPDGKGKCNGIYEPIHGSAPDISGKGIVNPVGTVLSVAMMLRYSLNLPKEADAVEAAVKAAIDSGVLTKDLGGSAGTVEMGDAIIAELEKILKA